MERGHGDELSRIVTLQIGIADIVDYNYLGLNQVVIQTYNEPSTPVDYTLATGTGSDPYDGLDRFGRIVNLRWQKGTTKLVDYDYTYDRVGNRLSLDVKNSPVIKHVDELYDYDGLYRLTEYDRGQLVSGSISSPDLTQEWTPDQTGNWYNFVQGVTGILNQTRSHNTTNEITNISKTVGVDWPTPTHDDNGNMTSFPQPDSLTNSYDATWDAWNRLIRLEDGSDKVAEFEYDGLGRRTIKKVYKEGSLSETRHFYYSTSSQVLEERVDSDTDPTQQFLWGIRFVDDLVLRDKDTTGNGTLNERLYSLSDPRFSILAITDNTGAVKERYAYAGFGRSDVFGPDFRSRSSSSYNWEYRYTGRRLDLETAIYYFRARFYHAELGRFVSRDPIGYVDGYNLYAAYFVPHGKDPYGLTVSVCYRVPCSSQDKSQDKWKTPLSGNCFRYVCDDIRQPGEPWNPIPGGELPFFGLTCADLSKALREGHKIWDTDSCGNCPDGFCKIYVVLKPGKETPIGTPLEVSDIHFYKKCHGDGSWSHKGGLGPVIKGVTNPEQDAKNLGYTSCGYMCIPPGTDADIKVK